ncbi:MAG: DUF4142 domain-containing protein [Planctomycetaceae bacterium]
MSRLQFSLAAFAISAFATPGLLVAQQPAPGQPGRATVAPPIVSPPGTLPSTAEQSGTDQPYQARRASTDHAGQGHTVTEVIVHKLKKANQGEIELAQMAQQKTDDQEVKQFAEMLVKDHQAFIQKLDQLPKGQQETKSVPHQLVQVMDQAHDNMLKMTKEMLQKHQGQDFRMAFLGQQIVAHTMMLSQLQAIESSGPPELQSLAQQGIEKTQSHLQKAKELANKNKDANE